MRTTTTAAARRRLLRRSPASIRKRLGFMKAYEFPGERRSGMRGAYGRPAPAPYPLALPHAVHLVRLGAEDLDRVPDGPHPRHMWRGLKSAQLIRRRTSG